MNRLSPKRVAIRALAVTLNRVPLLRQVLRQPLFVLASVLLCAATIATLTSVRATTPYDWSQIASDVSLIRFGEATALDGSVTPEQVLLFGGNASTGLLNDTWRFNGSSWTKLNPSNSPTARSGASLVYDPLHHQDVLFGGSSKNGLLQDTWVWNGTTWTKLSPSTSPAARQNASMVWDASRGDILLFGGSSKNGLLQDTWVWNGTTWTQLAPTSKPSARSSAAAAFDTTSGSTILFGGQGSKGTLADTWRFNGSNWSLLTMTTSPAARYGAGAAFDPITNQIILFGGVGSSEYNDTWTFSQSTWTKLSPINSPSARDSFGLAANGDGSLVLVDGKSGKNTLSGTWVWQTPPSVPQNVSASAGNQQATVSWNASLSGGSPITSYTVTASPGGATASTQSTTVTIPNLQIGTTYTFTVTATNALGTSAASLPSNAATTWSYPSAPQNVTASSGKAQAVVSWQAPSTTGGGTITGYTITPYIGSSPQPSTSVDASTLSTTITSLTNGIAYTFAVSATTIVGTGPAGVSNAVTPMTYPDAPQNVSASPGNGQATVSWQAPTNNGGSLITGYTITTTSGSNQVSTLTVDGSTLSILVPGLTNGTTYTFTVAAINIAGTGQGMSAGATPTNVPTAPQNVTATVNDASDVTVSWQTPAFDGGSPITGYLVTPYLGSSALAPLSAASSPLVVSGLNGSSTYTFVVVAQNTNGTGATSTTQPVTTPMVPCPVSGATDIWTGSADGTTWTSAGNWSAGYPPSSNDVACLPSATAGTSNIAVPAGITVNKLLAYKPLTIANGLSATNGIDLEANATWSGGTFSSPNITIASSATITVNGLVTFSSGLSISNNGVVQIVNGTNPNGITESCGSSNGSWTNSGTFTFANSGSLSLYLCGGSFSNTNTGYIQHTGSGTDYLLVAQLTNNGSITASNGVLLLNATNTSFSSGTVAGSANGQVVITGNATDSPQNTFGDNVWVTNNGNKGGTLSGTTVIAANATLHVGYNSSTAYQFSGPVGTIAGTITGSGTLVTAGFNYYPNIIQTAVIAADINVANTYLNDYANLASKPDGSAITIGQSAVVSIFGGVCTVGNVAVNNAGLVQLMDSKTNQYHGLNPYGLCASSTPFWANTGTLSYAMTNYSATFGVSNGTFANTDSGLVAQVGGSQPNYLSGGNTTNTGTIAATAGTLILNSPNGSLTGGTLYGTSGQVLITGSFTDTASATFGDNVWVTNNGNKGGTLSGTTVIAANATLHVGYNTATAYQFGGAAGTIAGTVTGSGTLTTSGINYYPNMIETAVIAADLNVANTNLNDYANLASKPDSSAITIGSSATVNILGGVCTVGNATIDNAGLVQLIDSKTNRYHGMNPYGFCPSSTPFWANTGTLSFAMTNYSATFGVSNGTFANTDSGLVLQISGSQPNYLSGGNTTNTGTIIALAGDLMLNSSNGALTGGTVYGTGGHVVITGSFTDTSGATFGDNVWVSYGGTLTGTTYIASKATLHVGYDASLPLYSTEITDTVAGSVTGSGTLNAAGYSYNMYPAIIETAVIAADINVTNAILGNYVTLGIKPDNKPTNIGLLATVTLQTTPKLASGLTLQNLGTVSFGTNNYFTCADCDVVNENGGFFVVTNPDGFFTHAFFINSGTFDNEGTIKITGYIPGVFIMSGPNVTLTGAGLGQGVNNDLKQPPLIVSLQSKPILSEIAGSVSDLTSLSTKASLLVSSAMSDTGVGQCENLNVSLGIPGASVGLCVVFDPSGHEAVAISVSGGASLNVPNPPTQPWTTDLLFKNKPEFSIDAGAMTFWKIDASSTQSFDAFSDVDGLAMCQNGVLVGPDIGGTGNHCWGPENDVPYSLGSISPFQPGVHSAYLGVVVGTPTISTGVTLSYSLSVSCSAWYKLTSQPCPAVNLTPPTVSGSATVGSTLFAGPGGWSIPDLNDTTAFLYEWVRCTSTNPDSCTRVTGATTDNTYNVTSSDRGYYLSVEVIVQDDNGDSLPATASPIGPVP